MENGILISIAATVVTVGGTVIVALISRKPNTQKTHLDGLQTLVEKLQDEVKRLGEENQNIRAELGKLRTDLDSKNDLISSLKEEKKLLIEENKQIKEDCMRLRSYNREKEALIKELQETIGGGK